MKKEFVITATVSFSTIIEGETMEEIETQAQNIFEDEPLANYEWENGEYELFDMNEDEDEEVE